MCDLLKVRYFTRRTYLTRIRLAPHKLPVETGRYLDIDRDLRICPLCKKGTGDELHVLFTCDHPVQSVTREKFLQKAKMFNPALVQLPPSELWKYLLGAYDKDLMVITARFVAKCILNFFKISKGDAINDP